jgi:hypothetical protein
MIEDKILDLTIIFESQTHTLAELRAYCRRLCLGPTCEKCTCSLTIEELEQQMHETQLNMKKVDILYKRAEGTARLVCILAGRRVGE